MNCPIFVAPLPARPAGPARAAEPARASLFGATVGTASVVLALAILSLLETRGIHPAMYFWALPALVLGAWAGPRLVHTGQVMRILLHGVLGPGLTMLVPGLPLALLDARGLHHLGIVVLIVMAYSLVAVPLSLPCAYLTARFNDPRRASPARQDRWMRRAGYFAGLAFAAAGFATASWWAAGGLM